MHILVETPESSSLCWWLYFMTACRQLHLRFCTVLLHYPAHMRKGWSNQFCPSVCLSKIARTGDLGIWGTINVEIVKDCLHYASNCLARPTSVANTAFLATPIDFSHVPSDHASTIYSRGRQQVRACRCNTHLNVDRSRVACNVGYVL